MSFYTGVTLKSHCILISDRRRTTYDGQPVYDDSTPKIWKIRNDLCLTAAGLLHLAQGLLIKVLPEVIKDKPLDLQLLEPYLPEWARYFSDKYEKMEKEVIAQLTKEGKDSSIAKGQVTSILLGGVDTKGVPFLIDFHSFENFVPHVFHGPFMRAVLPLFGENMQESIQLTQWINNAIVSGLQQLPEMPSEIERIKKAAEILPQIIGLVAEKDHSVSRSYDLVVIGEDEPVWHSGIAQ